MVALAEADFALLRHVDLLQVGLGQAQLAGKSQDSVHLVKEIVVRVGSPALAAFVLK